jgi:chromate transporter
VRLGHFLLLVFALNAVALGNGPVMIPLFQKSLEEGGVLSEEQFLFAVAVGQVTPGQANLYVAALGYLLFGIGGALLAVLVIVLPAYLVLPLVRGYEHIRHFRLAQRFTRGMTAASVGLILAAALQIGSRSLTGRDGWVVFVLVLGFMLLRKRFAPDPGGTTLRPLP